MVGVPLGVDAGETEPQDIAVQDTVHFAPCPLVSFRRVAVNCAVVPSSTTALLLETDRMIAGVTGGTGELPPHDRLATARLATSNAPSTRTRVAGDIKPP